MLIGGNQGFGLDLGILEHAGRVPGFGIDDDDGDDYDGDYINQSNYSDGEYINDISILYQSKCLGLDWAPIATIAVIRLLAAQGGAGKLSLITNYYN